MMPQAIRRPAGGVPEDQYSGLEIREQQQKYKELATTLRSIPKLIDNGDLRDQERKEQALAFYVESLKQIEPVNWKERLKELSGRINSMAKESKTPDVDVSWLMAELISDIYEKTLAVKATEAGMRGLFDQQEIYARCLDIAKSQNQFEKKVHNNNKPVSFGNIIPEFVPEWYKDSIIKKNAGSMSRSR